MASTHPFIQGLLGVVVGDVLPYEVLRYSPLQFCGSAVSLNFLRESASASDGTASELRTFLQKGLTFSLLKNYTTIGAFQNNHFSATLKVAHADVLAVTHHFEVFNAVVFLVSVFMVYNFIGVKKSARKILN